MSNKELLGSRICGTMLFDSLLDVGCGNGSIISYLLDHNKNPWGIESDYNIKLQSNNCRRIIHGNFETMSYSCLGKFDIVLALDILEKISVKNVNNICKTLVDLTNKFLIINIESNVSLWKKSLSSVGFKMLYYGRFREWNHFFIFSSGKLSLSEGISAIKRWDGIDKADYLGERKSLSDLI